ncbi:MAG: hypothetical protein Q9160_001584, partial [Pyrenula sp. 1 TL-2023]
MSKQGNLTPSTHHQWANLARGEGISESIKKRGVETLAIFPNISGSKMTPASFLVLRSIWKTYTIDKFRLPDWLLENNTTSAKATLSAFDAWSNYLAQIDKDMGAQPKLPADDIGTFSVIYYYQRQVRRLKSTSNIDVSPLKAFYLPRKAKDEPSLGPDGPPSSNSPSETAFKRRGGVSERLAPSDESSSSEDSHPWDDSPLALRSRRSGETAPQREAAIPERLRSSRRTDLADLSSSLDQLTLQGESPDSKGEQKQEQTPEHFTPLVSSPLDIVTPLKASIAPAANDEQIVNTALILLLTTITMFQEGVEADWTLHRRAFHIANLLETRTDGFLRRIKGDTPMAILEVKSHVRDSDTAAIQQQESAQMASWISEYPDSGEIWNEKSSGPNNAYV